MNPLDRKITELTALYEVARTLSASLDIKETSQEVLRILGTVLGMTRGTLTLYDPASDDLVITAAHGLTPEELARGRFKTGEDVHVLTVVASLVGQAVKLQRMVDDERRALEAMNLSLQHQLQAKYRASPIVGRSAAMAEVFEAIERVGGSRA